MPTKTLHRQLYLFSPKQKTVKEAKHILVEKCANKTSKTVEREHFFKKINEPQRYRLYYRETLNTYFKVIIIYLKDDTLKDSHHLTY